MSTYNPLKYLDHKIHNMLVFLSFHFHLKPTRAPKVTLRKRRTLPPNHVHCSDGLRSEEPAHPDPLSSP